MNIIWPDVFATHGHARVHVHACHARTRHAFPSAANYNIERACVYDASSSICSFAALRVHCGAGRVRFGPVPTTGRGFRARILQLVQQIGAHLVGVHGPPVQHGRRATAATAGALAAVAAAAAAAERVAAEAAESAAVRR